MHLDPSPVEDVPPPPFAEAVAASQKADAERIEPLRTFEQELPVKATNEELLDAGRNLAGLHKEIAQVESEIERIKANAKADLVIEKGLLEDKMRRCQVNARIVNEGTIERLVQCREEKVFATGTVRVVRLDTLEIVSERALESDERQAALFPEGRDISPDVDPEALAADSDVPDAVPCDESTGAEITDPAAVLPPEAPTNGKGRRRGKRV
jgi:hypothetical protein